VLHDQLPEHNAVSASILLSKKDRSRQTKQMADIASKALQSL
jgi:hypothetical protein